MPTETAETPRRVRMSWEDYLRLGDDVRGEYIDGELVVTPIPSRRHQEISHRLVNLLQAVAGPDQNVIAAWGWQPPTLPRGEFAPDVMVFPDTDDQVRFTGVPWLAVEILSTNRSDDLVVKATKYAHHGLADYWIVDPDRHQLLTYRLVDGTYALTGEHATGRVTLRFAETAVDVDLDALLA